MAVEHAFELLFEDFAERLGVATEYPATVVVFLKSETELLDGVDVSDSDKVSIAGSLCLGSVLGASAVFVLAVFSFLASDLIGAAGAVAGFSVVFAPEVSSLKRASYASLT